MTTKKISERVMQIFVVDGNLDIYPVKVKKEDWERGGVFEGETDRVLFPIIVCRDGWNKLTTYGGFGTKEEAQGFKDRLIKQERGRYARKGGKKCKC